MEGEKSHAKILGENLKRIRLQKNISRKQLADSINVGVDLIGLYENGKRLPPLDKIFTIADSLQVSILDLTDNNGYTPAKISADKQIFEYRYQQAFNLAIAAGYSPREFDGDIFISVPKEIKQKEKNGTIEIVPCISTFKIKDRETFVNVIEKVIRLTASGDMTFSEAFLLSNAEIE